MDAARGAPVGVPKITITDTNASSSTLAETAAKEQKSVSSILPPKINIPPTIHVVPPTITFNQVVTPPTVNIPSQVVEVAQEMKAGHILADAISDPKLSRDNSVVGKDISAKVKDLTESIKKADKEAFVTGVKKLFAEDKKGCALVIRETLKSLAMTEKNSDYTFITENLKEVFPQLTDYFQYVKSDEDRKLPEGYAITTKGIELMVQNLKARGKLDDIDCKVCHTPSDLCDHLANMKDAKEGSSCAFIMRHPGLLDRGVHVTPLYAEKRDGILHIVITDSAQAGYGLQMAKHFGKELGTDSLKFHIFVNKRQSDQTNCPIFALRDVVQYARCEGGFLDYVQSAADQPPVFSGDKKVEEEKVFKKMHNEVRSYTRTFGKLPAAMLKTTQSLTRIESFDPEALSLVEKHKREGVILGVKKDYNALVNDRFLKYERLIIAAVIAGAITT